MIKLDRKKSKKRNQEVEPEERVEVDFSQELNQEKLQVDDDRKGGLVIKKKPFNKNEPNIRKGPSMPSSEVLAALQSSCLNLDEIKQDMVDTKVMEAQKDEAATDSEPTSEIEPPAMKPPTEKMEPKNESEINIAAVDENEKDSAIKQPAERKVDNNLKPKLKLDYREPGWSDVCSNDMYKLEVLKGGEIIGEYKLFGKSYHVLGKLPGCDLILEHPSISRYHMIIQWHKISNTWKVMDYGSTHGVKMNKMRLKPHQYVRCTVGSVIEVGLSTRKYIMNGPSEDQLEESVESGFELREKHKARQKKLEEQMMGEVEPEDCTLVKKDDSDDDFDPSEQLYQEDNFLNAPSFLKDALDPHAFYHKDPLKAINHFFTSDNQTPPWILSQTSKGRWECKLELPIGDGQVGVTVQMEGESKTGATNLCALEACKALDRHGMFDEHAKARKKLNKLKENDFYESDEDEYFDRTGQLEQKRAKRKRALNEESKTGPVDNSETLRKIAELKAQLEALERNMEADKSLQKLTKKSDDPLETFMMQVKSGKVLDSTTRSKMHRRRVELNKEISTLYRSLNILTSDVKNQNDKSIQSKKRKKTLLNCRIAKKPFGILDKPKIISKQAKLISQSNTTDDIVETDSS